MYTAYLFGLTVKTQAKRQKEKKRGNRLPEAVLFPARQT